MSARSRVKRSSAAEVENLSGSLRTKNLTVLLPGDIAQAFLTASWRTLG